MQQAHLSCGVMQGSGTTTRKVAARMHEQYMQVLAHAESICSLSLEMGGPPVLVGEGAAIAGRHKGVGCQHSLQPLPPLQRTRPVGSHPGELPALNHPTVKIGSVSMTFNSCCI